MNETFRAIMSEVVLPVFVVGLVVAAIVVVTNYLSKAQHAREALHSAAARGFLRQPRIAGRTACERCPVELIGYQVGPSRIHWQHVTQPDFDHHPAASVSLRDDQTQTEVG